MHDVACFIKFSRSNVFSLRNIQFCVNSIVLMIVQRRRVVYEEISGTWFQHFFELLVKWNTDTLRSHWLEWHALVVHFECISVLKELRVDLIKKVLQNFACIYTLMILARRVSCNKLFYPFNSLGLSNKLCREWMYIYILWQKKVLFAKRVECAASRYDTSIYLIFISV